MHSNVLNNKKQVKMSYSQVCQILYVFTRVTMIYLDLLGLRTSVLILLDFLICKVNNCSEYRQMV